MSKIAFLFPGQGAQSVGMCSELLATNETVKKLFNQANEILGYDLADICLHGPVEKLDSTIVSQPAIFAASFAALEVLKETEPEAVENCSAAAGLSLGEYTALTFAGAMTFEEGLKLVQKRGEAMQESADATAGGMVSIMGLEREKVSELCAKVLEDLPGETLKEANFLCPNNIVLSGSKAACDLASQLAGEFGAMKATALAVAGAFHTQMMKPADEKLAAALEGVNMQTPRIPVYSNVDFQPHTNPEEIKEILVKQILSSVYWEDLIRKVLEDGFDQFYEIGPGRVLTSLMKRINRKTPCKKIDC